MSTPNPAEGAPERTVRVRRWSTQADSEMPVVLVARHRYVPTYDTGDDVYVDGEFIGTVTKYTGSIDTHIKGTRLRREGKQRTLWSSQRPGENTRTMFGHVSRAEAIRWMLR